MKKTYKLSLGWSFYHDYSTSNLSICSDVINECFHIFNKTIKVTFSKIRPHRKGWKLIRLISVDENNKEVDSCSMKAVSHKWVKICNKTYPLTSAQFKLFKSLDTNRGWMKVDKK